MHSILLRLIGTHSNRDGFGTRVVAMIDGRLWTSEVTASGSYLSGSDPQVLIGMGKAREVKSLKLSWPSGTSQELRGLEAGYLCTSREREGLSRPETEKNSRTTENRG
jgi:enediyne biosynthesis protein E4